MLSCTAQQDGLNERAGSFNRKLAIVPLALVRAELHHRIRADLQSRDDLRAWLKSKPGELVITIAWRNALRVLRGV